MKRWWIGLIVLLLIPVISPGAENWKIKLEEAKVYLDQKQYGDAEKILAGLAKNYSDQWEVNYYLGLVKAGKGENEEAEKYLRAASKLAPEDLGIRADLAAVLMNLNRPGEARQELDAVVQKEPNNARALYLRGVCLIQQDDCSSAEADLKKAKDLNPAYEAEISYYQGVCAARSGKAIEARRHFDQAIETGPGTVWADRANQALTRIPKKNPWFVGADIFYQYDSNIVPVSDEDALPEQISDIDDSRAVIWFIGGYRPLIREQGEIGLEYHFYNSWHFEVEEVNLQIHQGVVNGFYNFEIGKLPARVWAQYRYQYAGLGNDFDYYSTNHRGNLAFFLAETKTLVTELNYQYDNEVFDEPGEDDFDRDNSSHMVMLGQHFYVWNNLLDLSAFGRYEAVQAEGRNYDANRYGGRAMARLSEWNKFAGWVFFDYDYRDYYDSTYDRLDRVYSTGLEIQYQIIKYLAVFAGASFSNYDSNLDNYEYDREIYSVGLRADY